MLSDDRLLAIYDAELREELSSAIEYRRHGPLIWAEYRGGRGFVTYRSLGEAGADPGAVEGLVAATLEHYRAMPRIERVEWKTRGHDVAAGLDEALTRHGFVADEPESVMLGEAERLIDAPPPPAGVTVRRIAAADDVRRLAHLGETVFGDPHDGRMADALLYRLSLGQDDLELWVAEVGGEFVSAGRLETTPGSVVAGIWGGGTLPQWRGRGIYRALTAARARSALARGKTLIHSDSTEDSRPILERSGLRRITTTTPYEWRR